MTKFQRQSILLRCFFDPEIVRTEPVLYGTRAVYLSRFKSMFRTIIFFLVLAKPCSKAWNRST